MTWEEYKKKKDEENKNSKTSWSEYKKKKDSEKTNSTLLKENSTFQNKSTNSNQNKNIKITQNIALPTANKFQVIEQLKVL